VKWFKKKPVLPPIGTYPGYETSDLAFLNAQENVHFTIKRLNSPKWALIGIKNFMKYLEETKQKLPDKEFTFSINQKIIIWESFRTFIMKPENYGEWDPEIYEKVYKNLVSIFSQMPKEYRPNGPEWIEAAGLLLDSLNDALMMDRQILAQPIIENVLIIWLHYCLSLENR